MPDAALGMSPNAHDAHGLADSRVLLLSSDESLSSELPPLVAERLGCAFDTASEPTQAIEILTRTRVDLIVAHARPMDPQALQFVKRCREDRRLRTVPVLVLAEDHGPTAISDLLDAGARDCMGLPGSLREITARIRANLRSEREHRRRLSGRRYTLSGDLTALDFTDLVGLLEVAAATGRLTFLTRHGEGHVYFTQGRITHAVIGNVEGEEAIYTLIAHKDAQFEFSPGDWVIDGELPVTIFQTVPALVMEAARRLDEANAGAEGAKPKPRPIVDDEPEDQDVLDPPAEPSAVLAESIIATVSEPNALGELQILTRDQLRQWPPAGKPMQSWRCLLVTDLECGVQALSAMSAPLGEGQVANALRRNPQALTWSLPIDTEHQIEVVLIDQDHPRSLIGSIRRRPAAVIFAPTHGDFQTIDLEGRAGLIAMMYRLRPLAFFGVGNSDLPAQLQDFSVLADTRVPTQTMEGRLWNHRVDPREVLCGAVRAWAEGAAAVKAAR